ncbi:MAG: DEAD/DEAH box helicase [Saprospiraceae bacterium]|nr:DEAD/DEAH box helicase [Saprospiraceae bacterium]
MKFEEFGLDGVILEAISYMGFEEATPIQEQAIPVIMQGRDLLATAQTGTGKTAAFILPVIHRLITTQHEGTHTLVIAPTRELAIQIDQQIQAFTYFANCTSIAVYGGGSGQDFDQEKKALTSGADIIVATPGKLISHLNMGYVKFDTVRTLILDEADRMLDIGFYDDIIKIISFIPKERQTLMFSATMPPKIEQLSKKILDDPAKISIAMSKPAEGVLQAAYVVYENQKVPLLCKLIADKPNYESILIFTSTKKKVNEIARELRKNKFQVEGISSNLDQKEREKVLTRFRARKTRILVATDVLSRGIDIKDINLVINYDVPGDAEDYVHRVGRTARAETTGVALTLIDTETMQKFARIEQLIEREVPKAPLPPEIGEGPEWDPRRRPSKRKGKGGDRKKHHGGKKFKGGGKGKRSKGGKPRR